MKVKGGDIQQVVIYGREFDPIAESNVTYRLSGKTNETKPTGNGNIHTVQHNKLGGFDSLPISIDPEKKDLEFLQACADSGVPGACSMTHVNGTCYAGMLTIQDVIDANTGDGQAEISALGVKFEQV